MRKGIRMRKLCENHFTSSMAQRLPTLWGSVSLPSYIYIFSRGICQHSLCTIIYYLLTKYRSRLHKRNYCFIEFNFCRPCRDLHIRKCVVHLLYDDLWCVFERNFVFTILFASMCTSQWFRIWIRQNSLSLFVNIFATN